MQGLTADDDELVIASDAACRAQNMIKLLLLH
jgi:hypothetical protein